MKSLKKLCLHAIALLVLASCADESKLLFKKDKPASLAEMEYLNNYDALKAYIDRDENPNFKLGAGISVATFTKQGVDHSMIVSNFDEVTAGWEMKHGAVVRDDGTFNFASVSSLISKAKEAEISIYGHTLAWHANQNAKYLNSTIAPTVIPATGDPTWEVISSADFETDDESNYESNANAEKSFTADGTGADGTGRALKITNAVERENPHDSQFFVTFAPMTADKDKYRLSMDVRSDVATGFPTQGHITPTDYKDHATFGNISSTTTWQTYVHEVTITETTAGIGAIAFNLGSTATSYYFDNITVSKYNESGSSGPTLEASVITNSDFENGDGGWGGWGTTSTRGVSANGDGYGGSGYAYTFTNSAVTDFYKEQVAYDISPALEMGSEYVLNFKVKASAAGSISAEMQSSADYSSDGFDAIQVTTDWVEVTRTKVAGKADRNRFLISFGNFAGTVLVDDVTLRRVDPDGGGEQIIEKTPEEKEEIIHGELERWIAGMMEVSKEYVKAWDVVNEPMDDGNPYELKTGIGKDLAADEFYWQDYLGEDYAVEAFKMAAEYGNSDDILFINDYNLEYNLDKCRGLIEYVEYIESQGARVDGIGTQMHISVDSDKDKITEMFELLAATGKLIKISELDLGLTGGTKTEDATDEDYIAQSEMYQFVVEKYFELIPAAQRYGITLWSPRDSPTDSGWRAGEPIGIWTEGYDRKRAYGGFVEGLIEE